MIQMPGKRTRCVPVLILPNVKKAMDVLVTRKTEQSLYSENPYFFGTTPAAGHLDGYQIVHKTSRAAGLTSPELITSTNLRKYLATVAQVINRFLSVCSAESVKKENIK